MEITRVTVREIDMNMVKGIASIILDDCFVVHDLRVVDGDRGYFVAMPSRKLPNGDFKDIALLCNISSGNPGAREWLQQVQKRYHVPMIAGVTAVMAPDLYSFYHSGQIRGFLGGLAGAADYESLLERPGSAIAGMNVQSVAHLLIVVLIITGNVIYFWQRRERKITGR